MFMIARHQHNQTDFQVLRSSCIKMAVSYLCFMWTKYTWNMKIVRELSSMLMRLAQMQRRRWLMVRK